MHMPPDHTMSISSASSSFTPPLATDNHRPDNLDVGYSDVAPEGDEGQNNPIIPASSPALPFTSTESDVLSDIDISNSATSRDGGIIQGGGGAFDSTSVQNVHISTSPKDVIVQELQLIGSWETLPSPVSLPDLSLTPTEPPSRPLELQHEEHSDDATTMDTTDTSSTIQISSSNQALADYLIKEFKSLQMEGTNKWAEVSETLKTLDQERIAHCNEDIENLFIFAGVFSLLLGAFVLHSYQNLSPDPTDKVVQLLTQIAMQTSSYTIASTFVNATAPSLASSPPFEPSLLDLRVNHLWFSSLVLSMITASFCILVKQWLRSYTTIDPQFLDLRSRMRIQHFRFAGLMKWKVFEIAAILPLLMQVSLGLFLLGLCIFTWSFSVSIGRSCTVLVSAWIVFVFATALAPVFSSDCSYKIFPLDPLLRMLRTQLFRVQSLQWLYNGPRINKLQRPQLDVVACRWVGATARQLFRSVLRALLALGRVNLRGFFSRDSAERNSRRSKNKRRRSRTRPRSRSVDEKVSTPSHSLRPAPLEDSEVAQDSQRDVDMLQTAVLLNDGFLRTALPALLSQNYLTPQEVMRLLAQMLQHWLPHLQIHLEDGRVPMTDLRSLSAPAWSAVVGVICDTLRMKAPNDEDDESDDGSDEGYTDSSDGSEGSSEGSEKSSVTHGQETEPWVHDAFAILASRVNDQSIIDDTSAVDYLSFYNPRLLAVSPGALAGTPFKDIWNFLDLLSPDGLNVEDDPMVILRIHRGLYCNPQCKHHSPLDQAREHCPSWADQKAIYKVVLHLLDELHSEDELPAEDLTQILCATISWAACSCHSHTGSPRGVFLDCLFEAINDADSTVLRHLITRTLAEEFMNLFGNTSFSLGGIVWKSDSDVSETVLRVFVYTLHHGLNRSGPVKNPAALCYELHRQAWTMFQMTEPDDIQSSPEEWAVALRLLGDVTRQLVASHQTASPSPERAEQELSELAEKVLKLWSSESMLAIVEEDILRPYWSTMVECLHLFFRPDQKGEGPSPCKRGTGEVRFKTETLDVMTSNGWQVVRAHGLDLANGEPMPSDSPIAPTTDDQQKLDDALAAILDNFGDTEPPGQPGEADGGAIGEEDSTKALMPPPGITGWAAGKLWSWLSLVVRVRSAEHGGADSGAGDPSTAVPQQSRTCAELEKRRAEADNDQQEK